MISLQMKNTPVQGPNILYAHPQYSTTVIDLGPPTTKASVQEMQQVSHSLVSILEAIYPDFHIVVLHFQSFIHNAVDPSGLMHPDEFQPLHAVPADAVRGKEPYPICPVQYERIKEPTSVVFSP